MFCYEEGKAFKSKGRNKKSENTNNDDNDDNDDDEQGGKKISFGELKSNNFLIKNPKSFDFESDFQLNQKFFRKNIPFALRGNKEKELLEKTGIQNLIFVNEKLDTACGFTLKSVISLAEHSLYN